MSSVRPVAAVRPVRCAAIRPDGWLWLLGALLLLGGQACRPRRSLQPTPAMDTDPNTWIRVRLHARLTTCRVVATPGFTVDGLGSFADQTFTVAQGYLWCGEQRVDRGQVTVAPQPPHIFELDGVPYRGTLRLRLRQDGQALTAINALPLESYLAGVIGAEMPSYWEPEALAAQAVASRTYCLYIKERFGRGRGWDVSRSQAHQVYRGVRVESAAVWDALRATEGRVLVAPETGRLVAAYYSAVCGGHTEDADAVFGHHETGLSGVPCPTCRQTCPLDAFYWPLVSLDKTEVSRRLLVRYPSLASLGQVRDIVPLETRPYDGYARVTRVRLVGDAGRSETLLAEDLRLTLDPSGRRLRSTIFQLKDDGTQWSFRLGRGWGHGVGLCQYGAQGLARQGRDAEAILRTYYPNTELQCLDSPSRSTTRRPQHDVGS